MNLPSDRRTRRFLLALSLLILLALLLNLTASRLLTRQVRQAVLTREGQIFSSLLAAGLPEPVLLDALSAQDVTKAGLDLLAAAGRTSDTPIALLPFAADFSRSATLLLTACALLPGLLLSGIVLRYLRIREEQYRQATERLESFLEGDFSRRLPLLEDGEFGLLCAAADRMATALQARNEAERSARDFLRQTISDISHQLRTPLAALELYQQILAQEPDHPDAVRTFCGKMETSLERMEDLVLSLLKIARLDAGAIAFAPRSCLVEELAQSAVRDLTERARREGKTLRLEGSPEVAVRCDPVWTGEALGNLVKNALDHLQPGGTVTLAWARSALGVRIDVEDNGPGIPPEVLPHIFRRFWRGPDSPGLGLGLPLARAIAEGQGGSLTVRSEPGQGCVFALSLTKP